jgi:hypothetical protein
MALDRLHLAEEFGRVVRGVEIDTAEAVNPEMELAALQTCLLSEAV